MVLAMTAFMASCGSSAPEDLAFDLAIADRSMEPDSVQVNQNDTVTLNFTADEPGSLHLHGYDIEEDTLPGSAVTMSFVANATGNFMLTFHPTSAADDSSRMGHANSHDATGAMESSVPISIDLVADVEESGGVNLHFVTEGWRWSPERVDQANVDGEGHGHVYVDGEKVGRAYGSRHHLMGLEPGQRNIRVVLNGNAHNDLLLDGKPLQAETMVTVPPSRPASGDAATPIEAQAAMSVEATAHPDPAGGYNLQVMPAGFAFTGEAVGQAHLDGQGYASLSIDGEPHTRLYGPWFLLPKLAPGMHEVSVALMSNDHRPYSWAGQPVTASVAVHIEEQADQGAAEGHHGESAEGSQGQQAEEVNLGSLQVYPR